MSVFFSNELCVVRVGLNVRSTGDVRKKFVN